MRGNPTVTIRVPDSQIGAMETAAHRDHLSRSTWCREVLSAAAECGLTLEEMTHALLHTDTPTPALERPKSLGAHRVHTGRCLHPVHLVRRWPTRDVCTCGVVVAKRDDRAA